MSGYAGLYKKQDEVCFMSKLMRQIMRFGVVGGLAFLVDYGVLWALVDLLGVNYLVASTLSFSVSVIFNYILSSLWVFDCSGNGNKVGEFLVFLVLSILGLLLNLAIMWLSVDILGIHYLIAKVGSTTIVMVYNFLSRKLILERPKSKCYTAKKVIDD